MEISPFPVGMILLFFLGYCWTDPSCFMFLGQDRVINLHLENLIHKLKLVVNIGDGLSYFRRLLSASVHLPV